MTTTNIYVSTPIQYSATLLMNISINYAGKLVTLVNKKYTLAYLIKSHAYNENNILKCELNVFSYLIAS